MKNMILVAKKVRKNKQLLVIENTNKDVMVEIAKMSSAIHLGSKHSWVITNTDIDIGKNLELIDIKKYQRRDG